MRRPAVFLALLLAAAPPLVLSLSQCEEDYDLFLRSSALQSGGEDAEFWALKMADSYGSWPWDAVTEGNRYSWGSHYSCLEVDPGPQADFRGQHCTVIPFRVPVASLGEEGREDVLDMLRSARANLPAMDQAAYSFAQNGDDRGLLAPLLPPYSDTLFSNILTQGALSGSSLGMCVPSSCSMEEVQDKILGNLTLTTGNPIFVNVFAVISCANREDPPDFTPGDAIFITIVSLFALLVSVGTLLELKQLWWPSTASEPSKPGMGRSLLLGFSGYTNSVRLLDTTARRPEMIPCLDGIRFWSMTWVVVLHTYGYGTSLPLWADMARNDVYPEVMDRFLMRVVFNAIPSVDSFFLIGGCLLGYLTFKDMDRNNGKINIPLFYLHRYIRITGVYAVVVTFYATVFKFFAPFGVNNYVETIVSQCQNTWWKNLLYISNIYPEGSEVCMGHAWYLSAEMQMFWCTPLVLFPMWHLNRKFGPKAALALLSLVLAVAWAISLGLTLTKDWTNNFNVPGPGNYPEDYYIKAWTRFSPYVVGIGLGFVLHLTKKKKIKLNRAFVLLMWCLAFGIGLCVVYGQDTVGLMMDNTPPPTAGSVLYNTFGRSAWAAAMAWLVFACFHGYGGFINDFLSYEAFGPLGKLAFNVYLLHYPLLPLIFAQFTYSLISSHILIVIVILFVFSVCLVGAFVLAVGVEIPVINCDKILLGKLATIMTTSKKENK